jgi:hypothetical protein
MVQQTRLLGFSSVLRRILQELLQPRFGTQKPTLSGSRLLGGRELIQLSEATLSLSPGPKMTGTVKGDPRFYHS